MQIYGIRRRKISEDTILDPYSRVLNSYKMKDVMVSYFRVMKYRILDRIKKNTDYRFTSFGYHLYIEMNVENSSLKPKPLVLIKMYSNYVNLENGISIFGYYPRTMSYHLHDIWVRVPDSDNNDIILEDINEFTYNKCLQLQKKYKHIPFHWTIKTSWNDGFYPL